MVNTATATANLFNDTIQFSLVDCLTPRFVEMKRPFARRMLQYNLPAPTNVPLINKFYPICILTEKDGGMTLVFSIFVEGGDRGSWTDTAGSSNQYTRPPSSRLGRASRSLYERNAFASRNGALPDPLSRIVRHIAARSGLGHIHTA